jgi:hypothetical protein
MGGDIEFSGCATFGYTVKVDRFLTHPGYVQEYRVAVTTKDPEYAREQILEYEKAQRGSGCRIRGMRRVHVKNYRPNKNGVRKSSLAAFSDGSSIRQCFSCMISAIFAR